MKFGEIYNHYKNNNYIFLGIAIPLSELLGSFADFVKTTGQKDQARYHEDTHYVDVYFVKGAYFIDADVPHVIYQSKENYEGRTTFQWAREVDDFFGCKVNKGQHVQRFLRMRLRPNDPRR